jgi:peptidoglycan hydrolase FlgJ
MEIRPVNPQAGTPPDRPDAQPLMAAARALEATFFAEMLKHGGLNAAADGGFGGGAGEDAFASFLTDEYARLLSARGGIGLAERIFQALAAREDVR